MTRKRAIEENERTWSLLGQAERTEEENAELLRAAKYSLECWRDVGGAAEEQRGLWLLSRVHAALGNIPFAAAIAAECKRLTIDQAEAMTPFDVIYADEAVLRAAALAGAQDWQKVRDRLLAKAEALENPVDRKILRDDILSGPWPES